MNVVYLLLGSNLGSSKEILINVSLEIERKIGSIVQKSSFYESPPWGFEHHNNFLNQVLVIKTNLNPSKVLFESLKIEEQFGRVRMESKKYMARSIDIDTLFYNDQVIETKTLIIPHLQLHKRRFTLLPLNEVAPHIKHPVFNKTVEELLNLCSDQSDIKKL